jgi:hypothetical protein
MIKRVDITSPDTFAYIQEQLDLSGKALANRLLSKSLLEGRVFAYVPENTPSELLFRFETGGIYPFDRSLLQKKPALVPVQNDARPVVINDILKYLSENIQHCCLFEEPVGKPSDPWVIRSGIKYVHLDNEMYYFFGGDVDSEEFEKAFTTSEGYYFLCALSSVPVDNQDGFSPFNAVSSNQLKNVAANVVSFFVRAYDGEGYLQWSDFHS